MSGSLYRNDPAFTGLELVLMILFLIGAAGVFIFLCEGGEAPGWVRTFPGGLVADSMYMSGDGIQPVGSVYGFSAGSSAPARPVLVPVVNPGRMGSAQVMVSLFIGDTGAIDMDRLNMTWSSGGMPQRIQKTDEPVLVCPNWTIAGKYNMLPGRTADSDNWLEPNEQFMILACPPASLAPYQQFTLKMYPEGPVVPLSLTRTTPGYIRPVMNLG
ncbi:MAG: hypothetical protein GYA23_13655 [Methanomicrobiales archaeon]|nr:hypothetical protein [Methanomicrobiales archaeon]